MVDIDEKLSPSDIPPALSREMSENVRKNSKNQLNVTRRISIPVLQGLEILGYGTKFLTEVLGVSKQAISHWKNDRADVPGFFAIVLTSILREVIRIHRDAWENDGRKNVLADFIINVSEELCEMQDCVNQSDFSRAEWLRARDFVELRMKVNDSLSESQPFEPELLDMAGEESGTTGEE